MFALPDLPYAHEALEPTISAATLRIHHGRHHAKYVEMVNSLWTGAPDATMEDVIRHAAAGGERKLFNNAAQAWNHGFFWVSMAPGAAAPSGELAEAIAASFGDLDGLRKAFHAEAAGHFGSGWCWLGVEGGKLTVFSTHDADTTVTRDVTPLLVCDVWEHAYYLDYQNDRAGFLNAWLDKVANWDFAAAQLRASRGDGQPWRYPAAASAPAA